MTAAEPETVLHRIERCRNCSGKVLAHYVVDRDRFCGGWGGESVDECGNPERCCEKVCGVDDAEAALLLRCGVAGAA